MSAPNILGYTPADIYGVGILIVCALILAVGFDAYLKDRRR